MRVARSGLRRRLARELPSRPFALRFWDGTLLPATSGYGAMFTVRSPAAVAGALHAPGQLGIGRAYVAGLLDVDDLDAVLDYVFPDAAPLHLSRILVALERGGFATVIEGAGAAWPRGARSYQVSLPTGTWWAYRGRDGRVEHAYCPVHHEHVVCGHSAEAA